jgi:hypothetical protein
MPFLMTHLLFVSLSPHHPRVVQAAPMVMMNPLKDPSTVTTFPKTALQRVFRSMETTTHNPQRSHLKTNIPRAAQVWTFLPRALATDIPMDRILLRAPRFQDMAKGREEKERVEKEEKERVEKEEKERVEKEEKERVEKEARDNDLSRKK